MFIHFRSPLPKFPSPFARDAQFGQAYMIKSSFYFAFASSIKVQVDINIGFISFLEIVAERASSFKTHKSLSNPSIARLLSRLTLLFWR
jgi:hypothetical protein